jgi:prophage DNA circulation protein
MAWKNLLQGTFRGVPFEVLSVDRAGQRAIAEHEYPYTAGADLEDMNLRARRVRLRAFFWGDDYEERLAEFMEALEAPGAAELVHPVHGSMNVMAEAWEDEHDADQVDSASVNVLFVEDETRLPVFTASSSAAKADAIAGQTEAARQSADEALVRYVAKIPSTGLLRITALKDAFNQAKSRLQNLMNVTTGIKLLLSDLDPLLYPRAYIGDLLAIVDRGLQGLPFGGRNLLFSGSSSSTGSGAGDFATARKLLDPAAVSITPAVNAPDATMIADAAIARAHAQVYAAAGIAEAATIVLAGELEGALLERADVEAIANQTRQAIQVAIDSARASLDAEGRGDTGATLRTLAYAVEEAARAVINQRPPLVRKAAPLAGPVRLVAHALYGDATRAPEIVRLNRLGRNVMVDAGEVLYVYSA